MKKLINDSLMVKNYDFSNLKMLTLTAIILLPILFYSCSNSGEQVQDKKDILIEKFQKTSNFNFYKNASLDFDFAVSSLRTDNNRSTMLIPVNVGKVANSQRGSLINSHSDKSYVIPIFEQDEFLASFLVKNISADKNIGEDVENITGKLALGFENDNEYSEMYVTYDNGVVKSIEYSNNISNRYAENCCGCSTRGVLYCIGDKFEEGGEDCVDNGEGCLEEATCYVGFGLCLFARAFDCYAEECAD